MSYRRGKPLYFLGHYPCFICAKRIRVYEWLPDCVLCAACERKQHVSEVQKSR